MNLRAILARWILTELRKEIEEKMPLETTNLPKDIGNPKMWMNPKFPWEIASLEDRIRGEIFSWDELPRIPDKFYMLSPHYWFNA